MAAIGACSSGGALPAVTTETTNNRTGVALLCTRNVKGAEAALLDAVVTELAYYVAECRCM